MFCATNGSKTSNNRKMKVFENRQNWPKMKRLLALQNGQLGSKIKIAKNRPKTSLETRQSCSLENTAPKSTEYSRNKKFLKLAKIGQNGKPTGFPNFSV